MPPYRGGTPSPCAMKATGHGDPTVLCFDRLLLNALIQPFQQPERVIGFFGSYRKRNWVTKPTRVRSPSKGRSVTGC